MLNSKKIFKTAVISALILLLLVAAALFSGCNSKPALFNDTLRSVEPDPDVHVRLSFSGEPVTVYAPLRGHTGYRYGPSIMYYADGSSDAWFSCNGNLGEWDWVTTMHSADGITFGSERAVLTPNPDSRDVFSCCDPGAVYFGGYYYVGYTSTIESTNSGVNNNVFVARSRTAAGPYEKWNGSGWGGDPEPIVYYDEYDLKYGAGEPSMVVVDDVLYLYYTWSCPESESVRVATSDTAEDWPARLTYRGEAFSRSGNDSMDVAYVEDAGKFIGITTQNRFSENSGIAVAESDDGIHFTKTDVVCEEMYQYCHNCGISRRPDGHIQLKDNVVIGYAFSNGGRDNWGQWATAFQPVKLELYRGDVTFSPESKSVFCDDYFADPETEWPMIAIGSSDHIIELYKNDKHGIYVLWFDTMLASHKIEDTGKIRYYGYDKSLISIKDNLILSQGRSGETTVYVSYRGFENKFKVMVHDDYTEFRYDYGKKVKDFTPVREVYEIGLYDKHHIQLRGLVRFSDGSWGEAFNDGEMIDIKKFPVTYEVADGTVAAIGERGIIFPLSAGETDVKVTIAGEKSFTVKVVVTEQGDRLL